MSTTKTHWKKLTNPDYLGAYDFEKGEERIVTIKSVKQQMVVGADGKKEECTVAYFQEAYKPMIVNATNAKSFSKLADSAYIEDWEGKSFKLVVVTIKAFGEMVDALRVKSEKVTKQKPLLVIGSDNFNNCKKAYDLDHSKLDAIKLKYEVSAEVEKALTF